MPLLLATIDTLYDTIIHSSLRFVAFVMRESTERHDPIHEAVTELLKATEHLTEKSNAPLEHLIPEELPVLENEVVSDVPPTFKSIGSIVSALPLVHTDTKDVYYTNTVDVPVFQHPTIAFDTCVGTLPYATAVSVSERRGRFAYVEGEAIAGWTLRDDLAATKEEIYPTFEVGESYDVDHPTTARVRTVLRDMFGLNRSEFPLQAGEYVAYRLLQDGVVIPWPSTRPRMPGLWHSILKGAPGVVSGVTPKVGSIFECVLDGDVGHVAYVALVDADQTIHISEINYPDSGMYSERTLPRAVWIELRPVFIQIAKSS